MFQGILEGTARVLLYGFFLAFGSMLWIVNHMLGIE